MANRDRSFPGHPTSPELFRIAARMGTWPADEQELFLQVVQNLADKRITPEAFDAMADLIGQGKLTRREAFAYLGEIEAP